MDVQAQLIAEEILKQVQHLKYKNQQTKIFALWEVYIVKKNRMERSYFVRSERSTNHAHRFKLILYTVINFAALFNLRTMVPEGKYKTG